MSTKHTVKLIFLRATRTHTHTHKSECKRSSFYHFIGKFISGSVTLGNLQVVVSGLVSYLNSRNATIEQVCNPSIFQRIKLVFAIKLMRFAKFSPLVRNLFRRQLLCTSFKIIGTKEVCLLYTSPSPRD